MHAQILLPGCAGSVSCHTGSNPKEGLGLATETAVRQMLNTPSLQRPELMLVTPGSPDQSYLIKKLLGVDMSALGSSGGSSLRMPRLASPLCDEIVDVISEWILRGAVD